MINTKRLKIHLADENEMINFIENVKIPELKIAYNEMLEESKNHPDKKEWYAMWMIELIDNTHIGELCFKGINADGSAEIGYGIEKNFQNCGYATEAVNAVVKWALNQNGITKIIAQTDYENIATQKVLEKCGFIPTGKTGEEGPVYEKRK